MRKDYDPGPSRRSRPTTRSAASGSCPRTSGTARSPRTTSSSSRPASRRSSGAASSSRTDRSARPTRSSSRPASRSPRCRRPSSCATPGRTLREAGNGSPSGPQGHGGQGLPNLFLMLGPNTGLGIVDGLHGRVADQLRARRRRWTSDGSTRGGGPRRRARGATTWTCRSSSTGTVWNTGCASWYVDEHGRNVTLWPDWTFRFRQQTAKFDAELLRADEARRPSARRWPREQARDDHRRGQRHRRGGRRADAQQGARVVGLDLEGDPDRDILACDVTDPARSSARSPRRRAARRAGRAGSTTPGWASRRARARRRTRTRSR